MIILPKEKPILKDLNSYYINLNRLFEHYQGEIGTGAVYFKSPSAEGVIFFDNDEFLNGYLKDKTGEITGKPAIDRLIETAADNNFTVSIYTIDQDYISFWANLQDAKKIYTDLSTEFTDLEGLIKKMEAEKLTGYIDASFGKDQNGGLIYFNNGSLFGGSYSWDAHDLGKAQSSHQYLISKTKEQGGVFHVSKLPSLKSPDNGATGKEENSIAFNIEALEELLRVFENMVTADKSIKTDFKTLLRKKFVENVKNYPFLDPFAAEFEYSDGSIRFDGDASEEDLFNGVFISVKSLAGDLKLLPALKKSLAVWHKQYDVLLAKYGLSI